MHFGQPNKTLYNRIQDLRIKEASDLYDHLEPNHQNLFWTMVREIENNEEAIVETKANDYNSEPSFTIISDIPYTFSGVTINHMEILLMTYFSISLEILPMYKDRDNDSQTYLGIFIFL